MDIKTKWKNFKYKKEEHFAKICSLSNNIGYCKFLKNIDRLPESPLQKCLEKIDLDYFDTPGDYCKFGFKENIIDYFLGECCEPAILFYYDVYKKHGSSFFDEKIINKFYDKRYNMCKHINNFRS